MATESEKYKLFDAADYLDDLGDVAGYLEIALEASAEDPTAVPLALGVIARSQNMSELGIAADVRAGRWCARADRVALAGRLPICRWKAEFLEAGKSALAAGRSGPLSRESQLEAEVAELPQALGEAAVAIRVWKKSAEGRLGPSRTSR